MDDRYSSLLLRTCIAGCLLGLAATVYLLAGVAGYLRSAWLNATAAGAAAGAAAFIVIEIAAIASRVAGRGRWLWGAIVALALAQVALSLTPPIARDELTHHLAIPNLYVREGRIVGVPFAPYSYYPMLLDMLYIPWIYWEIDFVPKLVHGTFGWLTGLLIFAHLSARMNAVYGLLGFFFFASVPAVLRSMHAAYVDLGLVFYSTASLLCLVRWREEGARRWLALAACSAGFAAATKPNGLLSLALLSMVFLLSAASAGAPKRIVGAVALFGTLALIPVLPWLIKNELQTGNPFYPFLGRFFEATRDPAPGIGAAFTELGIFAKRKLLYGERWWQIAALPLRVFFSGRDHSPQYFDGVLTPLLILGLPWAFKGKWLCEKKLCIGFAALFLGYAIFLADLRVRYILPIVPPLVILLVYAVFNIYLRIGRPAYLYAGLLFFAAVNAGYLHRYAQETGAISYLAGGQSREGYLESKLAEYPAMRYVNEQTPETSKIYLLFVGRRAYYCRRRYIHDGGELPARLLRAVRQSAGPAEVAGRLRGEGITHLLVRRDLLDRYMADNLKPSELTVWSGFLERWAEKRFEGRGYAVYQLNG
ncbi:MAG TPA: hypothetical protein VNN77_04225 [candidate division Zixibacteria bacterium]|nr:hypothetical protein [candidate division Zixibacteria bacterium]